MIPRADITAWRKYAPWNSNEQVEQDLIICRALVELYSHPRIQTTCAFRGERPSTNSTCLLHLAILKILISFKYSHSPLGRYWIVSENSLLFWVHLGFCKKIATMY